MLWLDKIQKELFVQTEMPMINKEEIKKLYPTSLHFAIEVSAYVIVAQDKDKHLLKKEVMTAQYCGAGNYTLNAISNGY